jgi:hypothetical protein
MNPSRPALALLLILLLAGCASPAGAPSPSPSASLSATTTPPPPAAVKITLAAPAPTHEATALLQGTVDRPADLTVQAMREKGPILFTTQVHANATWSLAVPVPVGHTRLEVSTTDGGFANVTAIRLAFATFEAKYTAYPVHADSTDLVWFDPDTLASASMYVGKEAPRAAQYTVHDFMVDWTTQTGTPIDYGYSGSFGYSVSKIDGVGQPVDASAPPYWCYKLNGTTADLGISLEPMPTAATLTWEYAGCA